MEIYLSADTKCKYDIIIVYDTQEIFWEVLEMNLFKKFFPKQKKFIESKRDVSEEENYDEEGECSETMKKIMNLPEYDELSSLPPLAIVYPDEAYKRLENLKRKIPGYAYIYYVCAIMQINTMNISKERLLSMLEGYNRDDLMTDFEKQEFDKLPHMITIYRGTPHYEQEVGLFWSLDKKIAEKYTKGSGNLQTRTINKEQILVYLCENTDEQEI